MTSETKHNPIICILNCPNDASSKQLAISVKNIFPQNHLLCSMKTAVDLATKGKTPVLKLPSSDLSTIPGNLVPFIVSNWISTQLKKPPPKAAAKKAPPKKAGKGNATTAAPVEEAPHPPENENQLPTFVYLTEYPKTIEQMKQLCASSSPVICYINVDYNPATIQAPPEVPHKGNQQASMPPPPIDWEEHFSSEIPFISINLISQDQNPDEACTDLLKKVTTTYEKFQMYREAFQDYRFISIPHYPKEPLTVPQVAQEKVGKQQEKSGKGQANQPSSIAAQLTQMDTSKLGGPGGPDIRNCLQKAFKTTLIKQLDSFLERAESTNYSPDFQHAAETLLNYPLPAYLSVILLHSASKRAPELFTMRGLAYRKQMDYQIIENTLIINKFEELIGYSVGERRHIESIPLEFVPNVLAPLLSFYGSFKYVDFAGKILLAFFNPIPEEFPLSTAEESFNLPLAQGFGNWFTTQNTESDLPQESNNEESHANEESPSSQQDDQKIDQLDQNQNPDSDQTHNEGENQNEGESQNSSNVHFNSIGINVGNNDMFLDFENNKTTYSLSRYFCESGLRIDTIPPEVVDDLITSLFFSVQYGSNTGPRFSFNISQKRIDIENTNKNEEEEDDDENIETKVLIRGVLGLDTQCYLDLSSNDESTITLMMKKSIVVFDINNGKIIVTRTLIDKSDKATAELKRIITFKGDIIRYLANGSIVIYKVDGSIQTCLPNKEWHLIDANGHAYVKKDGQWFKDSQHDETSDVADTYFIPRKVTNWSHGVSFIEDDGELTIAYSDGTKYTQKTGSFKHPDLPEIRVLDQNITVETTEIIATFQGETRDCNLELKNNNISIEYKKESSHLLIQYGQFKKVMSMVDLYTGIVAHAGLNRCVYYLDDDYQWQIGRQNCSKKEILQHFQDNDFIKTLTPVDKFDHDSELLPIIANGHKPRLFIVEQEQSDCPDTVSVQEILAASDFQAIMESSSSRITSMNDNSKVTLWFDTEPKSYREITITPKITDEQKNSVFKGMEEQREIEAKRNAILDSVADPKWAKIDAEQRKEEEDIQALLQKYNKNQSLE
ncbi:hypothetical protein M9Y10_002692 [Tritrichomonas musculus]|uniref:LisH domain-containing protein n=1 Tax=Tritrichomonas musculus TaxID=1915356 RepID=A0ABR2LCT8_9EUKA